MVARTGIRLGANPQYASVVLFDQYSRSQQSQIFEIRETPIVISAFGLQVGESLQLYSSLLSSEGELLEPFLLDGHAVILTSSANSIQVNTTGRYRMVFDGILLLDMVCTYKHQTGGTNKDIRQPAGSQANRPNLFFDGVKLSLTSQIIEIEDTAWLFSAYGLLSGETITAYNTYGHGANYQQEPYLYKGVPQILTPTTNAIVLGKSGRYRFVLDGDPTHVVLVGNQTRQDNRQSDADVLPGVQSIVAGDNITVDATDPANPIVSATGGGNTDITLEAGETIHGDRMVRVENAIVYHPNILVDDDATETLGIALNSANTGEDVVVRTEGRVTEGSWTWTPGYVYCGTDGVLTQNPDPDGWLLVIGKAITNTTIDVQLETAFFRG